MVYNKSITATVYIINNGRVLLHMHKKYNTWFPIGGHILSNELPHKAAIREVKEETGLSISLLETENSAQINLGRVERVPLPFSLYHEGIGHSEEFLDFIYIAETKEVELHPGNGESTTLKWFSKEELLCDSSDIKPHVKNTALAVMEYLKIK